MKIIRAVALLAIVIALFGCKSTEEIAMEKETVESEKRAQDEIIRRYVEGVRDRIVAEYRYTCIYELKFQNI